MDSKTLQVLEYPKVLERLAAFCDFSASKELALALQPTSSLELAQARLRETSEARHLLATHDATIGGAHDLRPQIDLAARGGLLEPSELLDLKSTLIAMRELKGVLEKIADQTPRLSELAASLPPTLGLVDVITRTISERSEILDSASSKLASIRKELRLAHERLMNKLQKYLSDSRTVPMLQEAIITQRDGRYVIPLRAEFKGRIRSIVHDQSASGATLFVEPLAVVDLNNRYRELGLAERDEERRVLAAVSAQVGEHATPLTYGIQALAELDLAFGKAKYAEAIKASEPILHELKGTSSESKDNQEGLSTFNLPALNLIQARHPLLDPSSVVPIDVTLDPGIFALVITGPNTGGKTVTLKTVGLLVLMAQSGLHLPAQSGSELSCFQAVWADIGDEQSIEQSLSTFSGHILNIIHILKKADQRALVILDELGAGTDPQEGSALARAILTYLLERGITTFVATHYPELKTYAHTTEGVVNASLDFDIRTLRPTYKLTIGLPGRSNALAIAQRLGLPEQVIEVARSEVNPDELRADRLLDDIHRQRKLAHKERQKAEKARSEAHKLRRELNERLEKIEDERLAILEKARAESEAGVETLQAEIQELRRELSRAHQPLETVKAIESKATVMEEKVQKPATRRRGPELPAGPVRLGDKVRLRNLGAEGVVIALGESEAEVRVGALRVRARLNDLERSPIGQAELAEEGGGGGIHTPPIESPGLEISLRGKHLDEALEELDHYLDQAYAVGLPFVRIIHGKGTGMMRQAVREALRDNPHIASFEEAGDKEGGAGVTVAKLRAG
jgi:DNA mismatch repair protein MutS2